SDVCSSDLREVSVKVRICRVPVWNVPRGIRVSLEARFHIRIHKGTSLTSRVVRKIATGRPASGIRTSRTSGVAHEFEEVSSSYAAIEGEFLVSISSARAKISGSPTGEERGSNRDVSRHPTI